jgi:predicted RND superfamily exporter protein
MYFEIGRYVLMGLIAIFAIGALVLIAVLFLQGRKDKEVKEAFANTPKEDSLAEQIQKQFHEDDERKERLIYNKSGITRAKMKETRSAFSFDTGDSDNNLTLESQFADDDAKEPFIDRNKEDGI